MGCMHEGNYHPDLEKATKLEWVARKNYVRIPRKRRK